MVFGGRLTEPTYVKKIVADGDLNPKTRRTAGHQRYGISLVPAMGRFVCSITVPVQGCIVNCRFGSVGGSDVVPTRIYGHGNGVMSEWFDNKLRRELDSIVAKQKEGETVGVRPNMFSDHMWERTGIIDDYPTITFYDYTKI